MNIYQLNKCITGILMYKHNRGMLPNILNDNVHEVHTFTQLWYETTYSLQNTILWNQNQTKQSLAVIFWVQTMEYTSIMKNHFEDCTAIDIF